jgi:penicillin G amidase
MERLRRFAKGTLSELFGAETIEVDKLSLSLGLHRAAKDTWDSQETMSQDQREYFLTYAQGVNDYI